MPVRCADKEYISRGEIEVGRVVAWSAMAGEEFRKLLDAELAGSRLLATFPLSTDFRPTKSLLVFTSGVILALAAAFAYITLHRQPTEREKYRLIMTFRLAFFFLTPFINLLKLSTHSSEFLSILNVLKANELSLRMLNVKVIYKVKLILYISLGRFIFILLNEYHSYQRRGTAIRSLYILTGFFCLQSLQLQYYSLLHLLDSQLGLLMMSPALCSDVSRVLEILDRVSFACRALEDVYTHQALCAVGFLYLSFITSAYQVCMGFLVSSDFTGTVIYAIWALYTLLDLIFLADKTTRLANKVKLINKMLYRFVVKNKDKGLLRNVKLKLHFLFDSRVELTACRLFPIDYSMLHTILASTLVFLVVLIQMA